MFSKLAVRRLEKLAAYMDSLPEGANEHFYMGAWYRHDGDPAHAPKPGTAVQENHLMDCGTTACALGWATTIPEFQNAGLRMNAYVSTDGGVMGMPVFRNHEEFDAAEKFFRIDGHDSAVLFACTSVRTPKQWARHCRAYIKANT